MPYVTSLTNVLHQTLGWHCARVTFMAHFVLCSLQLTTTNLRRIAVSLKAGVEERSNYRRIRRFLAEYDVDCTALSRLLVRLVPQDPPYQEPPLRACCGPNRVALRLHAGQCPGDRHCSLRDRVSDRVDGPTEGRGLRGGRSDRGPGGGSSHRPKSHPTADRATGYRLCLEPSRGR